MITLLFHSDYMKLKIKYNRIVCGIIITLVTMILLGCSAFAQETSEDHVALPDMLFEEERINNGEKNDDTLTEEESRSGQITNEKAAEPKTENGNPNDRLFDGDINSRVRFDETNPIIAEIPENAAGLRFIWFSTPIGASVTWLDDSGQMVSVSEISDLYETMIPIPENAVSVKLLAPEEAALSEIIPINEHEVENYLYFIDPLTNGPIDAMVFCAHAGDEFISFGSLIPTLCDDGKSVLTVFMSHLNRAQLQEALDSAREMRQPYEPIFMDLTWVYLQADRYSHAKKIWDLSQTERTLLTMIRQYKPTVVFSHKPADDTEEGMRRYTAELVLQAVTEAAMPRKQGNITKLYGAHTVSKLYLSGEPAPAKRRKYDKSTPTPAPLADIVIDSETLLSNLTQDTNGSFTEAVYENYKTLRIYKFKPLEKVKFWLSYTAVGGDSGTNVIYDRIDASALSKEKVTYSASPTPVPTSEPSPTPEPTCVPTNTPEPERELDDFSEKSDGRINKKDVSSDDALTEEGKTNTSLYVICGLGILITVVLLLIVATKRKSALIITALLPAMLSVTLAVLLSTVKGSVPKEQKEKTPVETEDSDTEPSMTASVPQDEVGAEYGETIPEDTESPEENAETTLDGVKAEDEDTKEQDPNDIYFRQDGEEEEVVTFDDERGHWEYRSDTLSVLINRYSKPEKPLVYYVAHIRMRDVDQFRPGFGNENMAGSAKTAPWKLARRAHAVLAITGDNLVNTEEWLKGILIRNGQLYSERDHEPTMALMPDMTLKIYEIGTTAAEILDEGVQNTFAFGPALIRDGVIAEEECSTHRVKSDNPRCGLGMVEPGHYVAIVCDGRQKGYSMGTTLLEFAQMFKEEGCTVAYNMDGGISSGMMFMGEAIHQHHSSQSKKSSGQRPWADALLFGYSDLVPSDKDPVYNTGNLDEKKERPKGEE